MNVSKNSAPTGGGRQLRKITREDLKKNHNFYGRPDYVQVYFYCDFLGGLKDNMAEL